MRDDFSSRVPMLLEAGGCACNNFLRENGCHFSSDETGKIVVEWAALAHRQGEPPNLQELAELLAVRGERFHYSLESARAFGVLWRLLSSKQDSLEAIQLAAGAMRLFNYLARQPISDAQRHALAFLDQIVADLATP